MEIKDSRPCNPRLGLLGLLVIAAPFVAVTIAAPAGADCQNAGGTTICGQGDVRSSGGAGAGPPAGLVYPYPCEDDWLCSDGGVDIVLFPDNTPPRPPIIDRPGGGGGGGIGPR